MIHVYVLFPVEYARGLDPKGTVNTIVEWCSETYGDEARVFGWKVLDGQAPEPDGLDPVAMHTVIEAAADNDVYPSGGDGFEWRFRYSLPELTDEIIEHQPSGAEQVMETLTVRVGVCMLSEKDEPCN